MYLVQWWHLEASCWTPRTPKDTQVPFSVCRPLPSQIDRILTLSQGLKTIWSSLEQRRLPPDLATQNQVLENPWWFGNSTFWIWHKRTSLFFFTTTLGEANGDSDSLMMSASRSSLRCFLTASASCEWIGLARCLKGVLSLRLMHCFILSVWP